MTYRSDSAGPEPLAKIRKSTIQQVPGAWFCPPQQLGDLLASVPAKIEPHRGCSVGSQRIDFMVDRVPELLLIEHRIGRGHRAEGRFLAGAVKVQRRFTLGPAPAEQVHGRRQGRAIYIGRWSLSEIPLSRPGLPQPDPNFLEHFIDPVGQAISPGEPAYLCGALGHDLFQGTILWGRRLGHEAEHTESRESPGGRRECHATACVTSPEGDATPPPNPGVPMRPATLHRLMFLLALALILPLAACPGGGGGTDEGEEAQAEVARP